MTLIKWALILGLGWWGLKQIGLSPQDAWQEVREVLSDFSRDSKALFSGEALQKTSNQIRTNLPPAETGAPTNTVPESGEARELAQVRRQSMEAMREAVESSKGISQAVSTEGLKRNVLNNIRASGGE